MDELKVNLKQEKKEVGKMETIRMAKVNSENILEALKGETTKIVISERVTVRSVTQGEIKKEGQEDILWARLNVSDSHELKSLTEIGFGGNSGIFKLKLAGYKGESLEQLVGKEIDTKDLEIFYDEEKTPRGPKLVGLGFVAEFKNLKVVG